MLKDSDYDYGFIDWLQTEGKKYAEKTAKSYEKTCRFFLKGDGFTYPYVGGYNSFIEQLKIAILDKRIEESALCNQDKLHKSTTKRILSYYAEYIKSKDKEYNAWYNARFKTVEEKLTQYVNQQFEETRCLNFVTKEMVDEEVKKGSDRTLQETLDDFIAKKWRWSKKFLFELADISKASYYRWEKREISGIRNKNLYMIAFALKLNFEETKELIESAGRNFDSPRDKFDRACKFLIEEKVYEIKEVNKWLESYSNESLFHWWYNDILGEWKKIE